MTSLLFEEKIAWSWRNFVRISRGTRAVTIQRRHHRTIMKNNHLYFVFFAFALLPIEVGCAVHSDKTIGDLIQHFKKSGLHGEYQPKIAAPIGAKEAGGYSGEGFRIEACLFEDLSSAESLEKSGYAGATCHRNGKIILLIHEGESDVLPVFKKF